MIKLRWESIDSGYMVGCSAGHNKSYSYIHDQTDNSSMQGAQFLTIAYLGISLTVLPSFRELPTYNQKICSIY